MIFPPRLRAHDSVGFRTWFREVFDCVYRLRCDLSLIESDFEQRSNWISSIDRNFLIRNSRQASLPRKVSWFSAPLRIAAWRDKSITRAAMVCCSFSTATDYGFNWIPCQFCWRHCCHQRELYTLIGKVSRMWLKVNVKTQSLYTIRNTNALYDIGNFSAARRKENKKFIREQKIIQFAAYFKPFLWQSQTVTQLNPDLFQQRRWRWQGKAGRETFFIPFFLVFLRRDICIVSTRAEGSALCMG